MADALPLLAERVARLDGVPIYADRHGGLVPDIAHFIRTMQAAVAPGVVPDGRQWPQASPADADRSVQSCRLLQRLAVRSPTVVAGPVDREGQVWVASGGPAHLPPRSPSLDRLRFVEGGAAAANGASTKPFGLGLYTSTVLPGCFGMWWALLELNRGSTLTPLPWSAWSVRASPAARIFEVVSAADWARLVATYALKRDNLLYPDWARIAAEWDGVHMTLRAIVATQGIWLRVDEDLAAAPFWDVESTLWLRWVFDEQRLLHVENELPSG
jgi:hypothetical protein